MENITVVKVHTLKYKTFLKSIELKKLLRHFLNKKGMIRDASEPPVNSFKFSRME